MAGRARCGASLQPWASAVLRGAVPEAAATALLQAKPQPAVPALLSDGQTPLTNPAPGSTSAPAAAGSSHPCAPWRHQQGPSAPCGNLSATAATRQGFRAPFLPQSWASGYASPGAQASRQAFSTSSSALAPASTPYPPPPSASARPPSVPAEARGGRLVWALPGLGPGPTPRDLGFRMPGEWEPHEGTWMAFPYDARLWREGAKPVQRQIAALARAISQREQVWLAADPEVYAVAREALRGASGVQVVRMPHNDVWSRDWGPTCVVRDPPASAVREVAAVHWQYNCYGAPQKVAAGEPVLMADWAKDAAAGRALASHARVSRSWEAPLCIEGGALHSDGEGTLLVTAECLLHPSRNPHLSAAEIEELLCAFLGGEKVLWLPRGMVGDEQGTNGHVDNVACFARPGTVLLAWADPEDPRADPALAHMASSNLAALQAASTDARGRSLEVIKVPCPSPPLTVTEAEAAGLPRMPPPPSAPGADAGASGSDGSGAGGGGAARGPAAPLVPGQLLPGSYLNHYICNGAVVVPVYGGAQSRSDDDALTVLARAYPGRAVVPVAAREVLLGGGSVHCVTQQRPRGPG
ncbi:hypothetical protein HYH03_005341 [Edaphochlamys debaryana]|uniref:Agmatine deiminase n=1 Tax=Edaphochlamys debaryana TaxID=47281 RepID=A0A835Y518_9CHLO|nr:hypothetical protein HYH03_005341 [Edaphochlamys debaryana]|eukprot:KAG2496517.1 hypothetical protein HYH03_005341 [Edaphochlamys debaryana]